MPNHSVYPLSPEILKSTAHEFLDELLKGLAPAPFRETWNNHYGHFDRGVTAATDEFLSSVSVTFPNYEMVVVRHTRRCNLVMFRELNRTAHIFFAFPTGLFDTFPAGKIRTGWVQAEDQKLIWPLSEFHPIPGVHFDWIKDPKKERTAPPQHLFHEARTILDVVNA